MNSRDVEERVWCIHDLIRVLHEELVQDGEQAALRLPAADVSVTPNGTEMETLLIIGVKR